MSAGEPRPPRLFRADRGDAGERLDLVLLRHLADLPELSRTRIQALIAGGGVCVNGAPRTKVSDRIRAGDEVTVALPAPKPPAPRIVAQEIPLSVLYEDEHLLVIDKPAGLVVHPAVGHRDGTLVNALLWRSAQWGGTPDRPGLVHRLDKDTSGVLMVARTDAAHAGIARSMRSRAIEKEYLSVVYGRPPVRKGRVDLRILRDRADRKRMTTSRTEGRESSTLYELLGESRGERAGLSALRCLLLTGRTHQIRVHLRAIGLPIVGDPVYGAARWKGIREEALRDVCRDFPRQALHARRLALPHPVTHARLEVVAPVPPDVAALLAAAGLPAEP